MDAEEKAHVRALCGVAAGIGPNIVTRVMDALDTAERERDALRAELARLRTPRPSAIVLRPVAPTTETDAPVPFDDEDLALADGDLRALDVVTRERDEARAEVERLRAEVARACAEGFAEAVARAVAACDEEEDAGVAERARLVSEPRWQLYDLSRQEGRYHAANRLRFTIEALRPNDAATSAVIDKAVRQNEEVQRAEVGAAVAAEREACAAMLDERAREIPVCSCCGSGEDRRAEEELRVQARAIRARGAGGGA